MVDAPKGSDLVSRVNRLHLRQVWTPPHLGIIERNRMGLAEYRRWNLIAWVVSNLLSILGCLPHRSFNIAHLQTIFYLLFIRNLSLSQAAGHAGLWILICLSELSVFSLEIN